MPNWKRVIVSGSNAALNSLDITTSLTASGLIYPTSDGSAAQALITDGAGNLSFGSVAAGAAELVVVEVKNTSGGTLTKGTPVYITGTNGASGKFEIAAANASDSAKMPSIGLLEQDLSNNGEGNAVVGGLLSGIQTDTIDGTSGTSNDTIYVKAGGGLTLTKPTGDTNLIQNIGKIGRVHASNGSILVSSILRTNDIPNLPEGKIWVGGTNYTVTSSVVDIDETAEVFKVTGDAEITGSLIVSGSSADLTVTGNVGIGTTSPTGRNGFAGQKVFEVYNASSYASINVTGNGSTFATLGTQNSGVDLRSSSVLRFATNGNSNRMIIDTSGNVGIGQTSPTARLNVKGSGTTSATTALLAEDSAGTELIKVYDDGITAFGEYSRGAGVQSDDYITTTGRVRAGGGITFRPPTVNDNTWYGFDYSSNFLNVRVGGTVAKFGSSGANTNDSFYVNSAFNPSSGTNSKSFIRIHAINQSTAGYSGDVYALRITNDITSKSGTGNDYGIFQNNSGVYNYFNGNVGIGNSTPAEKLTVEGNISGSGNLNIAGGVTGSSFTGSFVGDGSALTGITAEWDGSHNGDAEITGSLIVSGSGVELEVFGDIQLRNSTEDALKLGAAGDLYGESTANVVRLQKPGRTEYFQFGTQTGYFQVSDGTNNIYLRAESTPEVSVTSTGALNYIQHNGTNNNNGNVLTWSNTTSGNGERGRVSIVGDLRLDDYSSGTASNAVNIENNGDAYFSGSVGIGQTSPALQSGGTGLHINATTSSELKFTNSTTGTGAGDGTALVSNVNNFFINNREAGYMTLGTSNTERMRITSTGNVGIGTTSPSTRLHISGSSTGDTVLIENNEGSSDAAPVVTLYRNSATPADGDYLGQLKFKGENDTGGEIVYAKITGKTSDVTNGTEDGLIETAVKKDGANVIVARQTGDALKLINGTGLEVDGATTLGDLSLTDLTVSGTASIAYIDVQFVSSSIVYSSGSNIFGDADDDVQTLNGDMVVNGTDLFVDASTSRVGITTNTPAHTLDVDSGDIRVSQSGKYLLNNSNVGMYRDANDLMLGGYGAIRFLSSATAMPSQTERMIIDGSTVM